MAVVIRMKRMGKHKAAFYRIVAADSRRSAKSGPYIEELGYYNPTVNPAAIKIDGEKIKTWQEKGAALTPTTKAIFKKMGVLIPAAATKKKKKKKEKAKK